MKSLQTPLNQSQLHILQMFGNMRTKKQLDELKKVLADYYLKKLDAQMDELFDSGKITMKDIENRAKKHQRTPYKK